MAQAAAHLVDHVIPHVPVHQWVLVGVMRLPIPLRLLLAAQPNLLTPVLQVVRKRLAAYVPSTLNGSQPTSRTESVGVGCLARGAWAKKKGV